jgi:transposase
VEVSKRLGIDKSAASRRVRAASQAGYLENLESRKGRTSRLVLGEPLPEQLEFLPLPERLEEHTYEQGRGAQPERSFADEAVPF